MTKSKKPKLTEVFPLATEDDDGFPLDQHKEHDLRELQGKLEDMYHELMVADESEKPDVVDDIRLEIEEVFPDAVSSLESMGKKLEDRLFSVQEDSAGWLCCQARH